MKKSLSVLLAICSLVLCLFGSPKASLAQAWAIGPDGRMGYIQTRNPISPNCTPPLVWTLTNGHYACQNPPPPPPPTCPGGTNQMAAPTWDGSAWVGLLCQPVAALPTADQTCQSAMQAQGFIVHNHYGTYNISTGTDDRYGATGPLASNACGDTTTEYLVDCITSPSTHQVLYLAPAASVPNCAGG